MWTLKWQPEQVKLLYQLDGTSFTMEDYDVVVKVYFKAIEWVFKGFTWSGSDESGYTAAANYAAKSDENNTRTVTAALTSVTTDPSCETAGKTVYTATVTADKSLDGEKYTDTKTVVIPALGHDLKETKAKDPTCTEAGNTAYWTCSRCGKFFSDAEGTHEIEKDSWILAALGHDWNTPVFTWEGFEAATAVRTCKRDPAHTEEAPCTITSEVTKEATANEDGVRTYTATATFDDGTVSTDTRTEAIPAYGWIWTRLSDADRYGTMVKVTNEAYPEDGTCTTLILATGGAFPDALAGAGLAGVFDCPIILTKKSTLTDETRNEIKRLMSPDGCNIIILGGEAAVTLKVEEAVKAIDEHITTERVFGNDRYLTAIEVYQRGVKEENGFRKDGTVIIATGSSFADALSISPYAYAACTPILLCRKNGSLTDEVKELIKSEGFTKAILIGGESVVSKDTEDYLKTDCEMEVLRLSGSDRYQTSAETIKWERGLDNEAAFQPEAEMTNVGMGIATGANFADALSSVSLLGKNHSVLMLVSNSKNYAETIRANIDEFIKPYVKEMEKGYILGGESAVSKEIEELLNAAIQ